MNLDIYKKLICSAINILLVACQPQVTRVENSRVKIPSYQSNGVFASARLRGLLQLKNECLYVNDILIVFPDRSAEWDTKNQTLTYKGKKIALGEELDIAGGFGRFEQDSQRIQNLSTLCDHKSIWFAG